MFIRQLSKDLEKRLFDLTLALYRVTDFFPPGEVLRKHLREKANEIFSQVLEYNYVEDPKNTILKILGKIQSIKGYLGIAKSLSLVRPINLIILEREYIFLADFFDKPSNTASATSVAAPTLVGTAEVDIIGKELDSFNQADKSVQTVDAVSKIETKLDNENSAVIKPSPVVVESDPNKVAEFIPSGKEKGVTEKDNLSSWQDFSKGNLASPSLRDEPHSVRLGGSLLLNERQEVILEYLRQTQQAKVSDFYSFFSNISSKTVQRDLQGLVAKNLLKKEGEKRWTVYYLKDINVH